MQPRPFIFRQPVVLLCSLGAALLYVAYATRGFHARARPDHLFYVAPIIVPFVAFLLDRAERFRRLTLLRSAADALVVGTALGRVVAHVPYISGHTLFLTYALLTTRSKVAQATAALVLLQTLYLKYLVWHDYVTSTSGIVLGALAALAAWGLNAGEDTDSEMVKPAG